MDYEIIQAGAKWQDTLLNALARCDLIVVVIGPQWQRILDASWKSGEADWVRTEGAGCRWTGQVDASQPHR